MKKRFILSLAILFLSFNDLHASTAGTDDFIDPWGGYVRHDPLAVKPWMKWIEEPLEITVNVQGTDILASSNSTYRVFLNDIDIQGAGAGCTNITNSTLQYVHLNLNKAYTLVVTGVLDQITVGLQVNNGLTLLNP